MRHLGELIPRAGRLLSRGVTLCLAVMFAHWIVASSAKAAPALTVAPSGLSFVAVEGGSSPPIQSLTVFTPGSGALSWFATSSAPWIQVIPTSGTTPSSALVMANVAGMAAGTYTGTIFFVSTQSGASQAVFVSVTVTPQTPQSQ